MSDNHHPLALQKLNDETLKIQWSDGTENEYNVRKLRYNCGCAKCVNEWSGERIVELDSIPKDIKPKSIESVGNYALRIIWSDGHDSGIYSYQSLKTEIALLAQPDKSVTAEGTDCSL